MNWNCQNSGGESKATLGRSVFKKVLDPEPSALTEVFTKNTLNGILKVNYKKNTCGKVQFASVLIVLHELE